MTEDQSPPRLPTLAELEAICAANGTTIEEIELRVVRYATELIEKEGRPVRTEDIEAYAEAIYPYKAGQIRAVSKAD